MAHHKSAKKRIRQNEKRRVRNRQNRSTLRTAIKKVEQSIEDGNAEQAGTSLKQAVPLLDKAVTKGLIHRNNASRRISRITRKVRSLFTPEKSPPAA
ncbi:MAG: 30S ribosomal protein S20 [bacterium]